MFLFWTGVGWIERGLFFELCGVFIFDVWFVVEGFRAFLKMGCG